MDDTPNLKLPYILPAQAQKHVTHNEALRALDCIVQLSVLDRDLATPPLSPESGARYIVADVADGVWTGHEDEIAAWQDGAWSFFAPERGWRAWIVDESTLLAWTGAEWMSAGGGVNPAPLVGVNASADATNRLSVKSDAVLLSHDDVTPGTGDQRTIVNKAASGNTASHLFQTGFSGRAEFGLAGDDDFHVKVSPDGASWHEAISVDRSSGAVRFPSGLRHPASGGTLAQLLPCTPVPEIWRVDPSRGATPRTFTISSVSGTTLNIFSGANAIFGTSMAGQCMIRVWNTTKSPAQSAWVVGVSGTTQLTVSDAANISGWSNGETLRLGDPNPTSSNVLEMIAVDISPYMQATFGAVFRQRGVLLATYASGTGGDVTVDGSGTGAIGSATGTASMSDGKRNYGAQTLFTSELSPVSNSNLVFLRESLGSGSALTTCYARLQGVYV